MENSFLVNDKIEFKNSLNFNLKMEPHGNLDASDEQVEGKAT